MAGYERVRDGLRADSRWFTHVDAAQLFKHAFALRTEVHHPSRNRRHRPILLYIYAEPENWPTNGQGIDEHAKDRHREEIAEFGGLVANDEVLFASCSYRRLLGAWREHPDGRIRAHAQAVTARFAP